MPIRSWSGVREELDSASALTSRTGCSAGARLPNWDVNRPGTFVGSCAVEGAS